MMLFIIQYAFLVTSVPLFLSAVLMFFTLVEHPRCVGENNSQFRISYVHMYHPYLITTGLSAPDEVHNSSISNIRLVQGE